MNNETLNRAKELVSQMTLEDFRVFILQLVGRLGFKNSTDACVCVGV